MGQLTGIDIAWDRPTIAQIRATGAAWVARYFSPDVTKNLTASEVRDYTAAGLGVVTVWESTATRALQGFQAGVDDAKAARGQRTMVGLPDTVPIHFAVDTDATWGQVAAYFQGVVSVLGFDQTGAYGGLQVIEGAHSYGIRYLWQTVAWSGGIWAPYATIRQPAATTLSGGADYDYAEVPDFGQYPRPEVDMPLTTADAELTAQTLLDTPIASPFRKDAAGKPLNITPRQYLEYLDKHYDDIVGMIASVKLQNQETQAALAKVGVPQLTPEQVQALAAQLAPAILPLLEQGLVPAILSAMGHKLDGTPATS